MEQNNSNRLKNFIYKLNNNYVYVIYSVIQIIINIVWGIFIYKKCLSTKNQCNKSIIISLELFIMVFLILDLSSNIILFRNKNLKNILLIIENILTVLIISFFLIILIFHLKDAIDQEIYYILNIIRLFIYIFRTIFILILIKKYIKKKRWNKDLELSKDNIKINLDLIEH